MESTSEHADYSGGSQPRPAAPPPRAAHVWGGGRSGAAAHQPTSHTAQPRNKELSPQDVKRPKAGQPSWEAPTLLEHTAEQTPGRGLTIFPADFLAVQCTHAAAPREYLHLKKRSPESKIPILRKSFFPFIFKSSFYFR